MLFLQQVNNIKINTLPLEELKYLQQYTLPWI